MAIRSFPQIEGSSVQRRVMAVAVPDSGRQGPC
jgi:hypothetical protein